MIAAEQSYRALGLKDTFMTASTHRKVRSAVRAALAEDGELKPYTDQMLEQLSRRVSLHTRLQALLDYVSHPATQLLGGVDALSAIARATEGLLELVVAKHLGMGPDQLTALVERRHSRIAAMVAKNIRTDTG